MSGQFDSANAGVRSVMPAYTLADGGSGLAANYQLSGVRNVNATISPQPEVVVPTPPVAPAPAPIPATQVAQVRVDAALLPPAVVTADPLMANVRLPAGGSLTLGFVSDGPMALLSAPDWRVQASAVPLRQAQEWLAPVAGGGSGDREVRVPVSRNSLVEIVNGGVRLPGGVDQLLFMVRADR